MGLFLTGAVIVALIWLLELFVRNSTEAQPGDRLANFYRMSSEWRRWRFYYRDTDFSKQTDVDYIIDYWLQLVADELIVLERCEQQDEVTASNNVQQ